MSPYFCGGSREVTINTQLCPWPQGTSNPLLQLHPPLPQQLQLPPSPNPLPQQQATQLVSSPCQRLHASSLPTDLEPAVAAASSCCPPPPTPPPQLAAVASSTSCCCWSRAAPTASQHPAGQAASSMSPTSVSPRTGRTSAAAGGGCCGPAAAAAGSRAQGPASAAADYKHTTLVYATYNNASPLANFAISLQSLHRFAQCKLFGCFFIKSVNFFQFSLTHV